MVTQHKSTTTTSKIMRWCANIPRIVASSAERAKNAILRLFRHTHTHKYWTESTACSTDMGSATHGKDTHVIVLFEWSQTPGAATSIAQSHTLKGRQDIHGTSIKFLCCIQVFIRCIISVQSSCFATLCRLERRVRIVHVHLPL